MQRENYKTMSVKQEAVDDFMEYISTYFEKTGELSLLPQAIRCEECES